MSEIRDNTQELERLYKEHFPEGDATSAREVPEQELTGIPGTIYEVLSCARKAKNAAKFTKLYDRGDISGYESQSEADLALMMLLAFWFNGDEELMKIAFGESALGERDKWQNRPDYQELTVAKALRAWDGQGFRHRSTPSPEVRRRIARLDAWAAQEGDWRGRNGPRNRYVFDALLYAASQQGEAGPNDGVKVATSIRHLALLAGFSKHKAVMSGIQCLQELGVVRVLHRGRKENTPNTYLLQLPPSARGHQFTPPVYDTVDPVRSLLRRVRENGRQQGEKPRLVRSRANGKPRIRVQSGPSPLPAVSGSIGKAGALLIEYVLVGGGRARKERLCERFGYRYPSELMRRCGDHVVDAKLLIDEGEHLRAPEDLEQRLRRHLEETGCNGAERNQRAFYEREREHFNRRLAAAKATKALRNNR